MVDDRGGEVPEGEQGFGRDEEGRTAEEKDRRTDE